MLNRRLVNNIMFKNYYGESCNWNKNKPIPKRFFFKGVVLYDYNFAIVVQIVREITV